MTGSSTTTSAWMLLLMPLALLIFSSPGHMSPLFEEMSVDLKALERCSEGFSETHRLNISLPQSESPFPYFIAGIKSMNCDRSPLDNRLINGLLFRLKTLNSKYPVPNNCRLNATYESLITPQGFHQKLKTLMQESNSKGCYTS